MDIVQIPIDELRPHTANPRRHDRANLQAIADSLQEFGQAHPLVVDRERQVLAGCGRLEVLRSMGVETVPCVVADLTPAQAKAFMIADNRTGDLSEFEDGALRDIMRDLAESDQASLLGAVGYTTKELAKVLQDIIDDAPPVTNEDETPPPARPGRQAGGEEDGPTVALYFTTAQLARFQALLAPWRQGGANVSEALLAALEAAPAGPEA